MSDRKSDWVARYHRVLLENQKLKKENREMKEKIESLEKTTWLDRNFGGIILCIVSCIGLAMLYFGF